MLGSVASAIVAYSSVDFLAFGHRIDSALSSLPSLIGLLWKGGMDSNVSLNNTGREGVEVIIDPIFARLTS